MGKILDLSCFMQDTITIKLFDGSSVDLPKPTQRFAIYLSNYSEQIKDKTKIVEASNKLTTMIMNTNVQGRKFTEEEVAGWPITAQVATIKAYKEFCTDLTSNPN